MTDMEYILSCIGKIYESDRFFSYDSMKKSCSIEEGLMRELGMEQVAPDLFEKLLLLLKQHGYISEKGGK